MIAKAGIVHRDLAARNVLLGPMSEPKIADFGFSRNLGSDKQGQTTSDLGPIRWLSPESYNQTFSEKSVRSCFPSRSIACAHVLLAQDVWAFGITAIEIMSNGDLPYFWIKDPISVAMAVREGSVSPIDQLPTPWPRYICNLIRPCFHRDPTKRPTFQQLADQMDKDFDGVLDDGEHIEAGKEESESEYYTVSGSLGEEVKPEVKLDADPGPKAAKEVWQKPVELLSSKNIVEHKQLGKGAYGTVHLATWNGELIALKRIKADTAAINKTAFKSELLLMSTMPSHKNVIKTKAYCLQDGEMFLVTELASNGSLDVLLQKIARKEEPPMDPSMVFYVCLSLAAGMQFLHSQRIVHRDVRALLSRFPFAPRADLSLSFSQLAARNILLQHLVDSRHQVDSRV